MKEWKYCEVRWLNVRLIESGKKNVGKRGKRRVGTESGKEKNVGRRGKAWEEKDDRKSRMLGTPFRNLFILEERK